MSITRVGDQDYNIRPDDTLIVIDKPFTAARTWTLPSGGVFAGERLQIVDASGLSATNFLTVEDTAENEIAVVSDGTAATEGTVAITLITVGG